MVRQYQELKSQHPGALLFFRLGDFYELFFEDAVVGARELQITLTARHKERDDAIPMCGVPHHSAANYIAKLVRKGYRVAICEQTEDASKTKKLVRREVVRIVTPGTPIDPQLLEARESTYLGAVCARGEKVAVFGRGGVLEQYDEPRRLLSNPANDFVAGFIGADRGYRGLQFAPGTGLPLHDIRTVEEAAIGSLDLSPGEWALVTRPDGSPYGWIDANGAGLHRQGKSLYDSTIAGGSLFLPSGTMRLALDAALSSPAGLGVAVDARKQVIGGIKADDVIAALKTKRGTT